MFSHFKAFIPASTTTPYYRPEAHDGGSNGVKTIGHPTKQKESGQAHSYQRYLGRGKPGLEIGRPGDIYMSTHDTSTEAGLYVRYHDRWKEESRPGSMGRVIASESVYPGFVLYCEDKFGPMWLPKTYVQSITPDSSSAITTVQLLRRYAQGTASDPSVVKIASGERQEEQQITQEGQERPGSGTEIRSEVTATSISISKATEPSTSKSSPSKRTRRVHHYLNGPFVFPMITAAPAPFKKMISYFWDFNVPGPDKGFPGDIFFLLSAQKTYPQAFYKSQDAWEKLPSNLLDLLDDKIRHPTLSGYVLTIRVNQPPDAIWVEENSVQVEPISKTHPTETVQAWIEQLLSASPFSLRPSLPSEVFTQEAASREIFSVMQALNRDLQAQCSQLEAELQKYKQITRSSVAVETPNPVTLSIGIGTESPAIPYKKAITDPKIIEKIDAAVSTNENNALDDVEVDCVAAMMSETTAEPATSHNSVTMEVAKLQLAGSKTPEDEQMVIENDILSEEETYPVNILTRGDDFNGNMLVDDDTMHKGNKNEIRDSHVVSRTDSRGASATTANKLRDVSENRDACPRHSVETRSISSTCADLTMTGSTSFRKDRGIKKQSYEGSSSMNQNMMVLESSPECDENPENRERNFRTQTPIPDHLKHIVAGVFFAAEQNTGRILCRICLASKPRKLFLLPQPTDKDVLLEHGYAEHFKFWEALCSMSEDQVVSIHDGLRKRQGSRD